MPEDLFISYSQNREDVVLNRVLHEVESGRYVDVGANDPVADSVTYAFYERGWSGIVVEPVHAYAEALRERRPRDQVVEAAISASDTGEVVLHEIAGTGLSTLVDDVGNQHRSSGFEVREIAVPAITLNALLADSGWHDQDIHFIVVDTEGAEADVLSTIDLTAWRPWILVVEATRPQSTEQTHETWEPLLLNAGYLFCLFDGLSRYYVAEEHASRLASRLNAPANILDNYKTKRQADLERENDDLKRSEKVATESILEWRSAAIRAWAVAADSAGDEELDDLQAQIASHLNHIRFVDEQLRGVQGVHEELAAMQQTLSWRLTKPLRGVRSAARRGSSP